MKIELKKLTLLNFQGIRAREIDFSQVTNIIGDNAAGKTTVFNAFTWLLFGKDGQDRHQFEIKTLDGNNNVIPKLNHEVTGIVNIDGTPKEFKRVLREKWTKKRGEQEAVFSGNTEDYFIDRVPMSKAEYQSAISEIIKEDQFKLITNPLYFNHTMEWKPRRTMLFKMAGDTTYEEVAQRNPKLQEILDEVNRKSIEGFKKQIKADAKQVREQLSQIAPRIDEQNRTMPEMPDVDAIKNQIGQLTTELEGIEGNLEALRNANKQKQDAIQAKYDEISKLTSLRSKLQQEAEDEAEKANAETRQELRKYKEEVESKQAEIHSAEQKITACKNEISELEKTNAELRAKIEKLNNDNPDFSQVQEECPTCKRPFDPDEVEDKKGEIEKSFNEEKVRKYNNLREQGIKNSQQITELTERIDKLKERNDVLQPELAEAKEKASSPTHASTAENFIDKEKIAEIDSKIEKIKGEIDQPNPEQDDEKEHQRKSEIQGEIDQLKEQLSVVKTIESKKERIEQLENESKDLAGQLAELEKKEFLADLFSKEYVAGIEEKINSMFEGVSFRMFRKQINEGETEDCTLIVNGVPWDALNSGKKIQAGIDCINTISKHYGYSAPIWIDNAESVIELPETESQLIRLVVSENHKKLTVENL